MTSSSVFAVTFVFLLITIVPFSTIYILRPFLDFHDSILLIPYYLSTLSIWINFMLTTQTKPGTVGLMFNKQTNPKLKPRVCNECDGFKPARAHHCSECDRCILEMDHHCPWMNNCIGHYNRAHFARFLVSVTFGTLYSLALLALRLYILILRDQYQFSGRRSDSNAFLAFNYERTLPHSPSELIIFCIVTIVLLVLLITVGILCGYQIRYLAKGMTTIEVFEMDKIELLIEKRILKKGQGIFPFDRGLFKNLNYAFGDKWLFWMVPKRASGDGLHFKVNSSYKDSESIAWPPKRYKRDPYSVQLLNESSGSDSSGYETESHKTNSTAGSEGKRRRRSYSPTAAIEIRHGDEGIEVRKKR